MPTESTQGTEASAAGTIYAPWLGFKHDIEPVVPAAKSTPQEMFASYFRRRGDNRNVTDPAPLTRGRAAQYQSWLTFGVLEAVLERPVFESELLEWKDGNNVMSSKNLPLIFQGWADGLKKAESDESKDEERFKKVLMLVRAEIHILLANDTTNVFLYSDTELVGPAAESDKQEKKKAMMATVAMIAVIAESLEIIRSQYRFDMLVDGVKPFKLRSVLNTCITYKQEMIAKGWCPFVVRKLESITATIYASTHEPVPSFTSHNIAGCTAERCKGNDLPKGDARLPSHYPKDCKCEYLGPPAASEVTRILKEKKIPVVSLGPSTDAPSRRVIVSLASDAPYVAVSHVWSDGLRDTNGSALPRCQLERIDKMTRELMPEGSGQFWLDTLCINDDVREMGILLMGQTYKGAAKVLVIDDGIRRCSKNAPLEEKLLRVLTSVWMQRLWTLQEAVYAEEMVFEFSDGLVPVQDLLPKRMNSVQGNLAVDLYQLVQRMKNYPGPRNYSNIWDISRALGTRSAGRKEDETLAIVDLIHNSSTNSFVLAEIKLPRSQVPPGITNEEEATKFTAAYEAKERMKAFLTSLGELPAEILYLGGRKLEVPGFSWAPSSFMTARGVLPSSSDQYCIAKTEGLVGKNGFISLSFDNEITLKPGQPRYIQTIKEDEQKRYLFELSATEPGEYSFNVIMMRLLKPRNSATFAAGMVSSGSVQEDDREDCEYKGLLQLRALKGDPKDYDVIHATYGRRNLCIT